MRYELILVYANISTVVPNRISPHCINKPFD